jgi:hypothetical protein
MGHHFAQTGHQMGHHLAKVGHEGTPTDIKMVPDVAIIKRQASREVLTRFSEAE